MARILDYHQQTRWGINRPTARWLVGLTLLIVVIWAANRWVPELRRYQEHRRSIRAALAAQQVCLDFAFPPETVVYSDDPADIASLSRVHGTDWVFAREGGDMEYEGETPRQRISRQTDEWRSFSMASGRVWSYGLSQNRLVAFMHHRRSPGGHDRLVVVETGDWGYLRPVVVTPGTADAPLVPGPCLRSATLLRRFSRPMRLFAGQPDPNDLSHFSFDYTYDGRRGTIDAYLDDNDGIRFHLEAVPASTTYPSRFYLDRARPSTAPSAATPPSLTVDAHSAETPR